MWENSFLVEYKLHNENVYPSNKITICSKCWLKIIKMYELISKIQPCEIAMKTLSMSQKCTVVYGNLYFLSIYKKQSTINIHWKTLSAQ